MPYNTLVQRSDASVFIPQRISNSMLVSLQDSSAALRYGTRIPMPAGVTTFPVLSALPTAYWVTGDTGMKQTTTAAWASKTITVDELAVIVPVPGERPR
jgi:HK97 family phage major capsid protein